MKEANITQQEEKASLTPPVMWYCRRRLTCEWKGYFFLLIRLKDFENPLIVLFFMARKRMSQVRLFSLARILKSLIASNLKIGISPKHTKRSLHLKTFNFKLNSKFSTLAFYSALEVQSENWNSSLYFAYFSNLLIRQSSSVISMSWYIDVNKAWALFDLWHTWTVDKILEWRI